jgi:DNA-binding NarL/FixJ family response regulator
MVVAADPFLRGRIVRTLMMQGAREVTEAGSAAEARARGVISGALELSVIDAGLPEAAGIELAAELSELGWQRGVVLSSADDVGSVRAALNAGVRAYLVTSSASAPGPTSSPQEGVGVIPRQRVHEKLATGPGTLSGRELEVIRLVAAGRGNKFIGTSLGLSPLTVKSHLGRISRKLGTGDRAEIVMIALRAGVIT